MLREGGILLARKEEVWSVILKCPPRLGVPGERGSHAVTCCDNRETETVDIKTTFETESIFSF